MTRELIERSRKQHGLANVAVLVTTVALLLSLVVAVTAVSIGIARADTFGRFAGTGGGWVAVVLGVFVAAMGWLTAAMVNGKLPQAERD